MSDIVDVGFESLLSMRTPRSRILSVKDMGRERIVYLLGVVLFPVILM